MNNAKLVSKLSTKLLARTLMATLLCAGSLAASAQTMLAPQKDRITDGVIQADHGAYRQLQDRLHRINETGRPVRDYHLSKAQCWLDVSFHEYTRNDRSQFPQEALTESEKLIVAMENKASPISTQTPLVNGAARLRPDLWEKAVLLRQHSGFQCAQQKAACAEVELVHAGNEFNQQQWRHAKPYIQIAEDLLTEADALAASCVAPLAAKPVVVAAVTVQVPAPAPLPVSLKARVLFQFDKDDIAHADISDLNRMLEAAKAQALTVTSISLTGHADRLNGTGNQAYNLKLSQRRAAAVRALLVQRGFDIAKMQIDFKGDLQQVEDCRIGSPKSEQVRQCLVANRRVEIQLNGVSPAAPVPGKKGPLG